MKKLFKVGLWIFGILFAVAVISAVASGGGSDEPKPTKDAETRETAAEPKEEPKKEEEPAEEESKITKEAFDSIALGDMMKGGEGGTSVDEVLEMFGEETTKSESGAGDMVMEIYTWSDPNFDVEEGKANLNTVSVSFTNGKATAKSIVE
jgi:Domain of Unknown Function with PDB structure (DUF3862)